MLSKQEIQKWPVLTKVKDITIFPKIYPKKASKAIKSYGDKALKNEDILLLVDNTILRSSKQGMFLTEDRLFAFSAFSGKFSIPLKDITKLRPLIEKRVKVPIFGFEINDNYFVSCPGLAEVITEGEMSKTGLEILLLVLATIIQCEIV
mgnify:FL=1|tara:strand:+ start:416 stop:862 length:447 start_codon:yes stop_codon:yes gene_type:complete